MIYYKITNHARGSLLTSDFSVNYSQHHWARGIGKLFVFDSLRSVNIFRAPIHSIYSVCQHPVWECEVRDPEPLSIMATCADNYERFWKSFPEIQNGIRTIETPTGTLCVSALKLLERVC